jgi:predicted dinucleotide-binding enzyme
MSYAIIGFGNIGQALAKAFARNGIEVSVATTRLTNIREYIDTQALARASEMATSPRPLPIETDTTRNDS